MSEPCPDCGRPLARTNRDYARGACPVELSRTEQNDTDHIELSCRTAQVELLKAQLAAATARASELEGLFQQTHGCHWSWVHKVTKTQAELAAMGERVARLEVAARAVVAADTYPMPGKTRFEATTEEIGKLEALLPELPAMCTANAALLQPDAKGKS